MYITLRLYNFVFRGHLLHRYADTSLKQLQVLLHKFYTKIVYVLLVI